jgi:hypothetical protein
VDRLAGLAKAKVPLFANHGAEKQATKTNRVAAFDGTR